MAEDAKISELNYLEGDRETYDLDLIRQYLNNQSNDYLMIISEKEKETWKIPGHLIWDSIRQASADAAGAVATANKLKNPATRVYYFNQAGNDEDGGLSPAYAKKTIVSMQESELNNSTLVIDSTTTDGGTFNIPALTANTWITLVVRTKTIALNLNNCVCNIRIIAVQDNSVITITGNSADTGIMQISNKNGSVSLANITTRRSIIECFNLTLNNCHIGQRTESNSTKYPWSNIISENITTTGTNYIHSDLNLKTKNSSAIAFSIYPAISSKCIFDCEGNFTLNLGSGSIAGLTLALELKSNKGLCTIACDENSYDSSVNPIECFIERCDCKINSLASNSLKSSLVNVKQEVSNLIPDEIKITGTIAQTAFDNTFTDINKDVDYNVAFDGDVSSLIIGCNLILNLTGKNSNVSGVSKRAILNGTWVRTQNLQDIKRIYVRGKVSVASTLTIGAGLDVHFQDIFVDNNANIVGNYVYEKGEGNIGNNGTCKYETTNVSIAGIDRYGVVKLGYEFSQDSDGNLIRVTSNVCADGSVTTFTPMTINDEVYQTYDILSGVSSSSTRNISIDGVRMQIPKQVSFMQMSLNIQTVHSTNLVLEWFETMLCIGSYDADNNFTPIRYLKQEHTNDSVMFDDMFTYSIKMSDCPVIGNYRVLGLKFLSGFSGNIDKSEYQLSLVQI